MIFHAKMKIICLITVIIALPAFLCPLACHRSCAAPTTFSDLQPSMQAYPFVQYLVGKNLIAGYPDGSFHPGDPIRRSEMAVLLTKAGALTGRNPDTPTFRDVPRHYWAFALVEAAVAAGLVNGEPDGTFRPEDPVTRAEAAALLLRLTHAPVPAVTLPGAVRDIDAGHWARRQVAAALDAGLLLPDADNHFAPDIPATRAEVARGLAIMLNIRPESAAVPVPITLIPATGKAMLGEPDRDPIRITANTACGEGAAIKTDAGGRAELRFSDGSGLLLDENTVFTLKKVRGQSTILQDGSQGVGLDCLEGELLTGRIFGFAPPYGLRWKQIFSGRSRVCINTPWSTAEIKGTLWMNEVCAGRQTTNVIHGQVRVTAAGHAATVLAGQTTAVHAPAAPPVQPGHMPSDELALWREAEIWVYERAKAIEDLPPVISPPIPVTGQTSRAADEIIKSFNLAVYGWADFQQPGSCRTYNNGGADGNSSESPEDTAPPAITGAEPENEATGVPTDQVIFITFSEDVQAGSAYDGIILQDAAGNAIPLDKSINGPIMVLAPVNEIYSGAPVNGVMTITFDIALSEAENLAVQLMESGAAVRTLSGRAVDCQLKVPYSDLKHSTTYTVIIPPGSVQSKDFATSSEEISWSFTTLPAPRVSP